VTADVLLGDIVEQSIRRYLVTEVLNMWEVSMAGSHNTLLSHLRLPQSGGPGSRIYIPQEKGGSVIPPGTGFPLCRLL
jgi:hypothetical protein